MTASNPFNQAVRHHAVITDKLQPLLQDISFERFERAHRRLAQPGLVHRFGVEYPSAPGRSLLQALRHTPSYKRGDERQTGGLSVG